jgi:uncharacterized protein (TIGR02118 family)
MIKMIALYTHPDDKAAFDRHYNDIHIPLVRQLPNLLRVEVARVVDGLPQGSPYYLIAEMYWETREIMDASMSGPEGRAVGRDARSFGSILSLHVAEVVE